MGPTPFAGPRPTHQPPGPNPGLPVLLLAAAIAGALLLVGFAVLSFRDDGTQSAQPDTNRETDEERETDRGTNRETDEPTGRGAGDEEREDEGRSETEEDPEPVSDGPPSFQAGDYRTDRILSLDQLSGRPEWVPEATDRIARGVWSFEGDGTFWFAPANARDDLYPIQGRWSDDGEVIRFEAEAQSRIGNSASAETLIYGTVRSTTNGPELEATWISTSGMAAVVGGTNFSSANGSAYQFTALLG